MLIQAMTAPRRMIILLFQLSIKFSRRLAAMTPWVVSRTNKTHSNFVSYKLFLRNEKGRVEGARLDYKAGTLSIYLPAYLSTYSLSC